MGKGSTGQGQPDPECALPLQQSLSVLVCACVSFAAMLHSPLPFHALSSAPLFQQSSRAAAHKGQQARPLLLPVFQLLLPPPF